MMTNEEWDALSKKAFPVRDAKAPAFLWTRVLSRIEAEENRRASAWWMQWRLMLKVTFALGLFAMASSYYFFDESSGPLDSAGTAITMQKTADLSGELDS